jgi:hypothetical protein
VKALQAQGQVASGPFASVAYREAGTLGRVFERLALVEQHQQAGASGQAVSERGGTQPAFEFLEMVGRQLDGEGGFATAHGNPFQKKGQNPVASPERLSYFVSVSCQLEPFILRNLY